MNPGNIFTCLICENFHTNSLDDLNNHILSDRSRPQTPTSDIMLVVNNNYICRLCNYKTNLKANYQLHSKTDKHLQKLNYINHIKEGGSRTEHKLNFPNSTSIQLKCNACEFFTNSMQKLTIHSNNSNHEKMKNIFKYLLDNMQEQKLLKFNCKICDFVSENIIGVIRHFKTGVHSIEGFEEPNQIIDIKISQPQELSSSEKNESTSEINIKDENGIIDGDMVLKCNNCEFFASSKPEIETHIDTYHENCSENYYLSIPTNPSALKAFQAALAFAAAAAQTSPTLKKPKIEKLNLCPLCENSFCQKSELEEHLVTVHSVNNSESVNRLLKMLEENSQNITSNSSHIISEKHVYKYRCKQCSLAFKTEEKLTNHSLYHTMRDATKCFLCHRTFRTTFALQKHMETHEKDKTTIDEDSTIENISNNEIETNTENTSQVSSSIASDIKPHQLSTSFGQPQTQFDVLSLMHFHHQLLSLNFMNLAPPLSFGSSSTQLSQNNKLPSSENISAVNLTQQPTAPISNEGSDNVHPIIQVVVKYFKFKFNRNTINKYRVIIKNGQGLELQMTN